MPKWLIYSTISMLIWAAWSLLSPIASAGLSGGMIQLLSSAGLIPVALLLLFSKNLRQGAHLSKGLALALATGVLAGTGNIMLYHALAHGGPVSVVFPLSSLAPLVPVLAAPVLFQERIRGIQWGGIAVALLAVVLLNATPSTGAAIASASLGSTWMMYALLSLVLYGITYLPQKGATYFISDELSTVAFAVGFLVLDVALLMTDGSLTTNIPVKAGTVSVVIGTLTGFGSLTLFMAYRHGKASIVTPYIQLFPVITVLLGVPLFRERIDWWRGIGIALALGAGVVLSLDKDAPSLASQGGPR
ncbi:MAG: DMT family transporter [Verrucomicrobiales bacterium]|nr:DMT family transporter [Verrucomicrobiales bacterium]